MIATCDKRWLRRRECWVPPSEVFRSNGYAVDVIEEAAAKAFVCEHHYSGSYPAARLAVGLFGPGPSLVGAAVFSVPMNQGVVPKYAALEPNDGAELGRFVCHPSVKHNGETWYLARAFDALRAEKGIRAVVSYADPLERRTAAGEISKRQHWGTIYQASNALYVGRAEPRTLLLGPNGQVVSARALSKIRQQTKGHVYATRQLLALGAPLRRLGEDPADWVARVKQSPGFHQVRHPGNLTYVFGLTAGMHRRLRKIHRGGLPYPKREIPDGT